MLNAQFNAGTSREAIRKALDLMEDPTPMFQDMAEYLVDQHRQRFIRGVDPQGRPWAPKSAATLDRYKRLGYGSLSRPLIGPARRLSREILQFVSRDGVVIGSSLIYSRVMQEGAAKGEFGTDRRGRPIPWGRIPAREWLGLSAANNVALVEIADEHAKLALEGGN